jgi:hypothetical protein
VARSESFIVKGSHMLWTIAVLLLILWLLGVVSSYTLGGFIHILPTVGRHFSRLQEFLNSHSRSCQSRLAVGSRLHHRREGGAG